MEIRHLRCFMAVAEELHFPRAAEKLHIEQSLLSRAIKEPEEQAHLDFFVGLHCCTLIAEADCLL